MQLYEGATPTFVTDSVQNRLADELQWAFFEYYGHDPSKAEVRAWQNSLRAMAQAVQYADVIDHGVSLEYQLPTRPR